MHELSLCESIIRIIERQAEKDGFTSVKSVTLRIGDMSGASEDALLFCFPLVSRGTVAEGATLAFVCENSYDLKISELEVS